jgi:hypothetical protein
MQEQVHQNWGKSGTNPGRPASPRLAGLALDPNATPLIQGQGNTFTLILSRAIEVSWSDGPKGLNHGWKGPLACKTRANTWEPSSWVTCKHWSERRCNGGTRHARVRPIGLAQAGCPLTTLLQADATSTDTRRASGPTRRSAVTRVHHPRPASLGEAGRPPSTAPRI